MRRRRAPFLFEYVNRLLVAGGRKRAVVPGAEEVVVARGTFVTHGNILIP